MKTWFLVLLVLVSVLVGYFFGVYFTTRKLAPVEPPIVYNTDTTIVYKTKTLVKTKVVNEKSNQADESMVDSLNFISDSLNPEIDTNQVVMFEKDSMIDEEVLINTDKKVASQKIKIEYLDEKVEINPVDSLLKNQLDIHDVKQMYMVVEFWESPINYSGYKLSKSKMIVFGLSPQLEYHLYSKNKIYYLNTDEVFYKMKETSTFLPLVQTDKNNIFND